MTKQHTKKQFEWLSSEARYWRDKYEDQMACIDPDNETGWRDEIHTEYYHCPQCQTGEGEYIGSLGAYQDVLRCRDCGWMFRNLSQDEVDNLGIRREP